MNYIEIGIMLLKVFTYYDDHSNKWNDLPTVF